MNRYVLVASVAVLLSPRANGSVLGEKTPLAVEWSWARATPTRYFQRNALVRGTLGVSSNGTDFIVGWAQYASESTGPDGEVTSTSPGVFVQRFDPRGLPLDLDPLWLATDAVTSDRMSRDWIAYSPQSDSYLAAWACSDGLGICAARVTSSGGVDPTLIRLPSAAARPVVVSDGKNHLVLAGEEMFVVAADGTWASAPLDFTPALVAFDGTNLLNVGDAGMTLFTPEGLTVATAPMTAGLIPQAITFDGTDYVILAAVPRTRTDIYVIRVTAQGTVVDTSQIDSSPYASSFDMSFDGLNGVGVWCVGCTQASNPVKISIVRTGDPVVAQDPLYSSRVSSGGNGVVVASNELGGSLIALDGFGAPSSMEPFSFHPFVQLLTTWAYLSVTRIGADGTVASDPPGISCGPSCLARFDAPTEVTLTATAAPGYSFIAWGDDCSGDGACVVTTDAPRAVSAKFMDITPPTASVPGAVAIAASSAAGAVVTFDASAYDTADGAITPSCAPESGSAFAPGVTRVTCYAIDRAGNMTCAGFDVSVFFSWSGVLAPVGEDGASVFKLGRVLPVRFALVDASAAIQDLGATLFVAKVSDGTVGDEEAAVPAGAVAGSGNTFRYDPASAQYVYNLATGALTPGTWRLRASLGDGIEHVALFSLKP